ncbi:glycosyltransferase [Donghicola mangrovi]|uniref:Glycosyltransferase family 2 protein n=1 Tax=Donghicola mangrovi TaxID=2729614 RepID=A0A850Q4M0_9RHOB|nr:glycosyltransferase family A protein [Donghicola mangrovi]NVO23002.1 glycosyltransferase family 2 protein [Donghicola mangrovi]
MKIDICICTHRRPHVSQTIKSISDSDIPKGVVLRIIIIDNDLLPTAEKFVKAVQEGINIPILYKHIPGSNISLARNAALDTSTSDWIAFLDDDETVDSAWLNHLILRQKETNADAVFGVSKACYNKETPTWIRKGDFHSQNVKERNDVIETGHTCNCLFRLRHTNWSDQRFNLNFGKTGGEDTEFFYKIRKQGAIFAVAKHSIAYETVTSERLTMNWLIKRRFRIGQSYAFSTSDGNSKLRLFVSAIFKTSFCFFVSLCCVYDFNKFAFWLLRAVMHSGVCCACIGMRSPLLYGK